jgi:hypothetical protein
MAKQDSEYPEIPRRTQAAGGGFSGRQGFAVCATSSPPCNPQRWPLRSWISL